MLKNKIITYSFCENFKDKLVEYIDETFVKKRADLSRLAVVFGGKRPAMFVKRDLAACYARSFYPPRFFTIDEWMHYTASRSELFRPAQDMDNCFLLYRLAQKIMPDILLGREKFVHFLPWTLEILKFIDRLDLEDIDDWGLKNIQTNAEIGYDVPDDINKLLAGIVDLRRVYHQALLERKIYSRGLQYLRAANNVGGHAFGEFDQILFCNFFYFYRTEEAVVRSLHERGKATLIFQGDMRKWPVLERIAKTFACSITEGDRPRDPQFHLTLHAGFDVQSQIALTREILKKTELSDKTVIVLPEPEHMIPLLSEISPLLDEFNISMGYPLKRSSLYVLFEFIFSAQLSIKDGAYYTKDYLKALRHPFIKNLRLSFDPAVTRVLVHKIEEVLVGKEKSEISGSLFINLKDIVACDDIYVLAQETLRRLCIEKQKDELRSLLEEIHGLLFTCWERIRNFQDFAAALKASLDILTEKSFMGHYPFNLNIAKEIYAVQEEFQNADFAREEFTNEEMFRIFDHRITREMVAFNGSPLKGLQILGLLETRSLNFDNVIVLDVNEGVLPRLRVHEPLIPREVMIGLGLNRLELEEEIQRYQFMRLISSAKKVHLVYQESRDKERSRFVEELVWEWQKKDETTTALAVTRPSFQVSVTSAKKTAEKTPAVLEFLKGHTYSASSINMYLKNPMEFYTSYVLGLREKEDLLDEPEARQVGTFMHELLFEAYQPFLNKKPTIDEAFRRRLRGLFERKFEDVFSKTMKSDSLLLRSVMAHRIDQFLDHEEFEIQEQVEKILYLESRFDDVVSLPAGDVRFRYVIDRVDQLTDGTVMIIDYKTGSADLMPCEAQKIFGLELSRGAIRDYIKSFQIPLYFHYLDKQFPGRPINAALYSLRTFEFQRLIHSGTSADRKMINQAYLTALNAVMAEIFDPSISFEEDLQAL